MHCKLIAKLECYGVDAMLLACIRNFLIGRSQFVGSQELVLKPAQLSMVSRKEVY